MTNEAGGLDDAQFRARMLKKTEEHLRKLQPAVAADAVEQKSADGTASDNKHQSKNAVSDPHWPVLTDDALSGTREFYRGKENSVATTTHFHCTDLGNAERLIARHGRDLLFCNPWSKWLVWDRKRWKIDNTQQARQWARATVRAIYADAEKLSAQAKNTLSEEERLKLAGQAGTLLQHATKSEAEIRINAMIHNAQMDVPVLPEQLDTNPWLLTVSNGTLDLKTGELRPHNREDLLTRSIPVVYNADASAPIWEEFLRVTLAGKEDDIDFLWKAIGYSLTGDTQEDCLFLLYGAGANGKSTFLNILRALLGEYGKQAAFSTFLYQERDAVRNDLADLRGARLVVASEAEEGKRLSESLIKALTGRDLIKARFLFQEHFEFMPQMKLWLAANHKPVIRGTDYAIWRRIRLLPFTEIFQGEACDKELPDKLKAELPGILAWAVRGCLAWQQDGLPLPESVKAATEEYRSDMDVVARFLEEKCHCRAESTVPSSALYSTYSHWCETNGEKPLTQMSFANRLKGRGHLNDRNTLTGKRQWQGIALMSNEEEGKS